MVDLSVAGNGDAGDVIAVSVVPSDGSANGSAVTDSVGVENQAPIVDSATISPASPTTSDTLTAVASGHDPDGTPVTLGYQWTKNGSNIPGATASTLDLSVAGRGDRGDSIGVVVTASDGSLQSDPLAALSVTVAGRSLSLPLDELRAAHADLERLFP